MLVIRAELQRRGMSQSALSRASGLNMSTVNMIVNGRYRPYPRQLDAISRTLRWPRSPEELLDEAPE